LRTVRPGRLSSACDPERNANAQHCEALQVHRGGKERKVMADAGAPAHACAATAVAVSHKVAELALDFGPGGPVARFPGRISLPLARALQGRFVRMDADAPALDRLGALTA
jgi:hypothetical protein